MLQSVDKTNKNKMATDKIKSPEEDPSQPKGRRSDDRSAQRYRQLSKRLRQEFDETLATETKHHSDPYEEGPEFQERHTEIIKDSERHSFEKVDRILDDLLDLTSEPVAIFGSHALYRVRKGTGKLPSDTDIATTPQGAIELYEAWLEHDKIEIIEHLHTHDPYGLLKAIRFTALIKAPHFLDPQQNYQQAVEVFGEGGEEYRGLFRLGDNNVRAKSLITDKLIRPKYSLESYKRLIKEAEMKNPLDRSKIDKWAERIARIDQMKRKLQKTWRFDREEFLKTFLD